MLNTTPQYEGGIVVASNKYEYDVACWHLNKI